VRAVRQRAPVYACRQVQPSHLAPLNTKAVLCGSSSSCSLTCARVWMRQLSVGGVAPAAERLPRPPHPAHEPHIHAAAAAVVATQ
jgi:hypothetical protein